jgi:hypothetical protein
MINWIIEQLKSTAEFLIRNIFWTVMMSIITVPVFLSWVSNTLDTLFVAVQTPTPVWGAIALALLVLVYVHLKTAKNHSSKYPKKREVIFESDNFNWKAVIHSPNWHTVENIPFCKLHNKRLIPYEGNYVCPDKNNDVCETVLKSDKYQLLKDIADSEAEHVIRTNNY